MVRVSLAASQTGYGSKVKIIQKYGKVIENQRENGKVDVDGSDLTT